MALIKALLNIQEIPTNIYDKLNNILNDLLPFYHVNNNNSGVNDCGYIYINGILICSFGVIDIISFYE